MDILAARILGSLRHIIRSIDQQNRRIRESYHVTQPQLVCIRALLHGGPMTSRQLAEQMYVSQATVTGVLDRLEAKGVIARERSTQDRRKVFISLTASGETMAKEMPWPLQERFAHSLELLDEEERMQMVHCLERLVELMHAPEMVIWPYGTREDLPPEAVALVETTPTTDNPEEETKAS